MGGDDTQYFETPTPKNNSVTVPSAHILLGYDSLKCQDRNRTHRSGQKLFPPGKWYICFQIYGETAHDAQFSNSRVLTKVIYLVLNIESFEQQCVIIKGLF